jgi:hypothetical protein
MWYGVGGLPLLAFRHPARNLAPLRRGFFMRASPPARCATNSAARRWGGGLPLMIWPLGGKLHQTVWTNLAPSPWRGFFCDLPCAVQPSASAPLIAVGLLVTFAEWQPRDGAAPNWPGANGRPLRGCRSRSRARQVSRRASTIAHGLRSSSCKLRRPAPHIAMESADARLRSGEAGFLECSKPGRVRHRNQRFGSTFCRWLSPAWC